MSEQQYAIPKNGPKHRGAKPMYGEARTEPQLVYWPPALREEVNAEVQARNRRAGGDAKRWHFSSLVVAIVAQALGVDLPNKNGDTHD